MLLHGYESENGHFSHDHFVKSLSSSLTFITDKTKSLQWANGCHLYFTFLYRTWAVDCLKQVNYKMNMFIFVTDMNLLREKGGGGCLFFIPVRFTPSGVCLGTLDIHDDGTRAHSLYCCRNIDILCINE